MCLVQLFTVVVSDVRARTPPTMNTEPLKGLLTHNPYNACNIYYVEGACACTRVCLVRACVHACVPVRTRVHVTCVCVRARFLRMCVCVCVCGQGLGFVVFDDTPYIKKKQGLGFVVFDDTPTANDALEAMEGSEVSGKEIKVY